MSDVRRFAAATGWQPGVGVAEGLGNLYNWRAEMRNASRRSPAEAVAVRV